MKNTATFHPFLCKASRLNPAPHKHFTAHRQRSPSYSPAQPSLFLFFRFSSVLFASLLFFSATLFSFLSFSSLVSVPFFTFIQFTFIPFLFSFPLFFFSFSHHASPQLIASHFPLHIHSHNIPPSLQFTLFPYLTP